MGKILNWLFWVICICMCTVRNIWQNGSHEKGKWYAGWEALGAKLRTFGFRCCFQDLCFQLPITSFRLSGNQVFSNSGTTAELGTLAFEPRFPAFQLFARETGSPVIPKSEVICTVATKTQIPQPWGSLHYGLSWDHSFQQPTMQAVESSM